MIHERYGDSERAEAGATAEHVIVSEALRVAKTVEHIDCTLSVSVRSGDPDAVARYLAKEAEGYAEAKGGQWQASHVYSMPAPGAPAEATLYSISLQRSA